MSMKLKIVIGSTRPGRVGPTVADWVTKAAKDHAGFDVELVDLDSFNLPLLDEPNHPAMQDYQHDHTKAWSAAMADADAYIFVTPEYDYFPPAALVNALQALSVEWRHKVAGVVSYGGISGGTRAAQELRSLISTGNMMPLPQVVPAPMVWNFIEDGTLKPNDEMSKGLTGLLDELQKWAGALKPLRSEDVAAAA
ncbi:NADPH-dependent FMN reductase [Marinibacterium profundimaris]|uniref:NADPH-dependent FMN reductase n=1 Tax=Marinibacterium profundimaris TaxID=1679460 RepID=A0A225NKQ0_9RHOB|nr:NAD(P)H-dependent oxidoreductase [Marinibacterium profundimaris]OWU74719.1 NADPH-dependent FMN reductase [Marinibacterium profundimaris]